MKNLIILLFIALLAGCAGVDTLSDQLRTEIRPRST